MQPSSSDCVPAVQIEAQLQLILASPQFSKSERMYRFLRFVVEQALQKRIDNNVRTEARRRGWIELQTRPD